MVTGICDPNKSRARHHRSLKLGSKLKYLNIIRDIINLFDHEDESYYKPVKVDNIFSNNYVEYGSYSNRNKTLSVEEYIHKT